ncbi:MAG: biotin-dependent carboxyltransferase family protein [Candidatus Nanopelagicales bacterium]
MTLEVLNPGIQSIICDAGRFGLARYGVPRSGAFDRGSYTRANQLVGNDVPNEFASDSGPASIETIFGGLRVQAHRDLIVAVTGATGPMTVLDHDADDKHFVPREAAFTLTRGSRLHVAPAETGLRSYLAVRGGFGIAAILGSRSTDTNSGIGPAKLAKRHILEISPDTGVNNHISQPNVEALTWATYDQTIPIRPGSHANLIDGGISALTESDGWTVSPTSGRNGVRLAPRVLTQRPRVTADQLSSEPTLCGAIQALPSGELVVLGPDGPTTGGYPVVAVLDRAGVDVVAQARPGAVLRFTAAPD